MPATLYLQLGALAVGSAALAGGVRSLDCSWRVAAVGGLAAFAQAYTAKGYYLPLAAALLAGGACLRLLSKRRTTARVACLVALPLLTFLGVLAASDGGEQDRARFAEVATEANMAIELTFDPELDAKLDARWRPMTDCVRRARARDATPSAFPNVSGLVRGLETYRRVRLAASAQPCAETVWAQRSADPHGAAYESPEALLAAYANDAVATRPWWRARFTAVRTAYYLSQLIQSSRLALLSVVLFAAALLARYVPRIWRPSDLQPSTLASVWLLALAFGGLAIFSQMHFSSGYEVDDRYFLRACALWMPMALLASAGALRAR